MDLGRTFIFSGMIGGNYLKQRIDPTGAEAHKAVMLAMLRKAVNGDPRAAKVLLEIQAETIPYENSNKTIIALADLINNPAPDADIDDLMIEADDAARQQKQG